MNNQTLERLLIDDALGALTADTSALLAAYTASTGTEEQRLKWKQLSEVAIRALYLSPAETAPPFPQRRLRIARIQRAARAAMAIAATLVIGVGIGLCVPNPHSLPASSADLVKNQSTAIPVKRLPVVEAADIWSTDRLIATALEHKDLSKSEWHWSSPVIEPELRGTP